MFVSNNIEMLLMNITKLFHEQKENMHVARKNTHVATKKEANLKHQNRVIAIP